MAQQLQEAMGRANNAEGQKEALQHTMPSLLQNFLGQLQHGVRSRHTMTPIEYSQMHVKQEPGALMDVEASPSVEASPKSSSQSIKDRWGQALQAPTSKSIKELL